jgi:phosphatidate cytidylyltransferase
MNELLDTSGMFESPVARWGAVAAGVALLVAPLLTVVLERLHLLGDTTGKDVWKRYFTWLVLAPVMLGAVLACPASAIAGVLLVSLLCYREFARATGLFRHLLMSVIVAGGIILTAWANLDNWYGLYVALPALVLTVLSAAAVLPDDPKGYLQRVSLAAVAFLLFGTGLNYLGLLANYPGYRPILMMLIACSQLSDIAAYCFGKALGRRKLFPNTSPNKTLGGHVGAMIVIAPLAAFAGHIMFKGSPIDTPLRLAGLGLIIAAGAQLGDLVIGSIKRDIGIKDMGATLPGHGGFLDRFNSLLLIAPAAFHYINFFGGFDIPITRRHLLQQLLDSMGVGGGA